MKKLIFLMFVALIFSVQAIAHQAFTLVSSEKKTVKEADLAVLQKSQTEGKKSGTTLIFTENEIRLVVLTGPEDDMLSFRIQGMRNPTLVVPSGATLKILFVNIDGDMKHDIRFGHVVGEFVVGPDIKETAGADKLSPKSEDGMMQAEDFVIRANEDGAYKYFCSVGGHANGGMWGNIAVGIKPGNLKMPVKTAHVHSPDEDKMENMPGMKPTEKKPDDMSNMPGMKSADKKSDGMSNMPGMNRGGMEMRSTVNVGEPMTREGSGTSWVPDSSPMHAYTKMLKDGGMLMVHGAMFLRYTAIGSSRDVSIAGKGSRRRFDAPSMFMVMYSRPINEKSQLGLRAMLSLDPLIERGWGYPLLYQSGETFRGRPLHDRQHPHEFISELAATYSYKIDDKNSFFLYAGYPGEPALGPPMFLHRASGANDPDAPIGHHWQDATHVAFGVLTAGFTHGKFKFEASAFKGREPDENRWAFDPPKLDSFSGRLSLNPNKEWSLQISYGYLKNPEPAEPEIHITRRLTASAIYNKVFDDNRNWSNTFVWGQNYNTEGRTNAVLFESNYEFHKNSIFGRFEEVQKNSHELDLAPSLTLGNLWVGAYSLGYLRDIIRDKGVDVGIGTTATFNTNPTGISSVYGGTRHTGWQVFLRLRPSRMDH